MADVTILDVGHGNCAVLCDRRGTMVIDAATGETLLEFLEQRGVTDIDAVLVSHGDEDHIAGVVALLNQREIVVRSVYLNPEPLRKTKTWQALLRSLGETRVQLKTRVHTELTTESSQYLARDEVQLEILSPTPEMALACAGGHDLNGRPLSTNAMSAVIRIISQGVAEVLLPGDIDLIGLENLLHEGVEVQARVLVFPHHGIRPGGADPFEFAMRLCGSVRAEVVVFSIDREKHRAPLPEIIRGVRQALPEAHIACTQLSQRCAKVLPKWPPAHLGGQPARGRPENACCAGTLVVVLNRQLPVSSPSLASHTAFVDENASTALCMGRGELDSGLSNVTE